MTDVAGWIVIAFVITIVVLPVWMIASYATTGRTERKGGSGPTSGGLLGFDELVNPSAENARIIVEEQRRARVALPAPGDPPLELEHGRIVISPVPDPGEPRAT